MLSVSINAGFPDSDIFDAGPSVTVTGDGPSPRWREIAEAMMDDIWERRDERTVTYLTPAEAVAQAKAAPAGAGPAVIADYADNPGSGAYGDATGLLAEMLDARLENAAFGGLCDPEAAGIMTQAGQGAEVTLALGGKTDPRFGGGPLTLTGTVQNLSDGTFQYGGPMFTGMPGGLGPTTVLRCGGSGYPGDQSQLPDARPGAVPRRRHRTDGQGLPWREIDAALPRRLRPHRQSHLHLRYRRPLLARLPHPPLPEAPPPGPPPGPAGGLHCGDGVTLAGFLVSPVRT